MHKRIITLIACCCVALCVGYYWLGNSTKVACPNCNVILISIDTLRADHLGLYGYKRPTSPQIDALATSGIVFDNAISQAPSTTPSHGSIFTGLIPAKHGALYSRRAALRIDRPTMAELLKARDYRTASFNGGGQLGAVFGFDRGFDVYQSFPDTDYPNENFSQKVELAKQWLGENGKSPFFLFLHSYEVHHPYAPSRENLNELGVQYSGSLPNPIGPALLTKINKKKLAINSEDRDWIVSLYDAEIRSMDKAFGELFRYLNVGGFLQNTVVILLSDHGEEFGEHGRMGWHSHSLFDELIKVPLVMWFPGSDALRRRIPEQVRLVDVMPSVLNMLDHPVPADLDGKSLLGLISKNEYLEPLAISQRDTKTPLPTSVRSRFWKLYRKKLFDLQRDQKEKINAAAEHPDVLAEFSLELDKAKMLPVPQATPQELKNEAVEQLKTLGYL